MSAILLRQIEQQIEVKYDVLKKLSEGGMGAVYQVRHRLLDEVRVLKVMQFQRPMEEDLKAQFLQEARILTLIRHPCIANVHDFSLNEDAVAFIVMEFVEGITLEELIHQRLPPLGLTLEIAQQTLRVLTYLHGHGIVHRNISSNSLMLTAGPDGKPLVKLIDLGISKILESTIGTGTFLGNVRFAPPELFGEGGAAAMDARADLYAFGILLYELLTGRYPIRGKDSSSLIAGHLFRPPVEFEESDPEGRIPKGLRRNNLGR